MRILICTVGAAGHINPLVPVAQHLCTEGHDVAWATNPGATSAITAAGITLLPVGSPFGVWMARLAARTRGVPGGGVPGPRKPYWFVPRLFCEVGAADVVDDLLAAARGFGPDLVVFESRCYAAPAVAAALGVAQVRWEVTVQLPEGVEELANDAISPLWGSLGLGTPRLAGVYDGPVFSPFPASIDRPRPDVVVHRIAPPALPLTRPAWLDHRFLERPLVYATLGTAFSSAPVMRALLAALAASPVSAVVTLGNLSRDELEGAGVTVPGNVRLEQYVDQERLLPHCAAVISHGGAGTVLGALGHGLPQVCVPQGADQFLNAFRVQGAGAGVAALPHETDADTIAAALARALTDQDLALAAKNLAAEMHAGLALADVSRILEATAG